MQQLMKKIIAFICAVTLVTSWGILPEYKTSAAEEVESGTEITENQETTSELIEIEPTEAETTTAEPETHENGQTSATYAASSVTLMNSNFVQAGEVGGNQYKITTLDGAVTRLISIQMPGDATENGIYIVFNDASFGEMTVNGVTLAKYIDGSGICLYLSNFVYMYSDVVIKDSSGKVKTVLAVYNAKGIDNKDAAMSDGGTETLPVLPEGETRAQLELQSVSITDRSQKILGNYSYAGNPGTEAKVAVDPNNKDHIQIQNVSEVGAERQLTLTKLFTGLETGKRYVISLDITASVANGSYDVSHVSVGTVQAHTGTKKISYVTWAYDPSGSGSNNAQINFTINLTNLGSDVVFDVCNPTIREATEEDLITTTPVVTTAAPTVQNPTTVAPTTGKGDKPTTQNPTTNSEEEVSTTDIVSTQPKQETTVGVVDTDDITVGKTKVKKATKKLTAKKISIKLKKVKGTKKYQIQISKKKKFNKKNILLTKTVKKINLTITYKKIKNKKNLWIRARAIKQVTGRTYRGDWSKIKKVNIKK